MAGRGRGRGRGMSFNLESLGFGRGETLPGPILQPAPNYPPLEFKPVSLATSEEWDYLLALKQEYRSTMRDAPYFIKALDAKKDIERYSDKYQISQQEASARRWEPDWSRLPRELKIKSRRKFKSAVQPRVHDIQATRNVKDEQELVKHFEELEKKEMTEDAEESKGDQEKDEEGGQVEEEEYYDDDDLEEETDYNVTYFDNGENYGYDDDDDVDDGPTY